MSNVVALCVGVCGFVVFTHLLRSGSLGAPTYTTLLIATGLLCIAIAKIDLVEILDLKNMRLGVQKARDDVYAKVEELQRIAAGVASFTTASIVSESRFVGLDHQDRMLRQRDELERFLKDAGVPEVRDELLCPITTVVDCDMRRAIGADTCGMRSIKRGQIGDVGSIREGGVRVAALAPVCSFPVSSSPSFQRLPAERFRA
jgi:hypothetical protein